MQQARPGSSGVAWAAAAGTAAAAAAAAATSAADSYQRYLGRFPHYEFCANNRARDLADTLAAALATDAGWALLAAGLAPTGAAAESARHANGDGDGVAPATAVAASGYVLAVDYAALEPLLPDGGEELVSALQAAPLEALACLAAVAHDVAFRTHAARARAAIPGLAAAGPGEVEVRLTGFAPSELHIRQLKSSAIGKLVTLKGTVTRLGHVRPLILHMGFMCAKCGAQMDQPMPDGRYTPPTSCAADGCRSRHLLPDRSRARCIDWQKMRLQELLGADQQAQGKVPRSVEVELGRDLVNACGVGDVVTVLGLVKVLATGDGGGGKPGGGGGGAKAGGGKGGGGNQPKQNMFLIYVDALSVVTAKRAARADADVAAAALVTQQQQQQQQLQGGGLIGGGGGGLLLAPIGSDANLSALQAAAAGGCGGIGGSQFSGAASQQQLHLQQQRQQLEAAVVARSLALQRQQQQQLSGGCAAPNMPDFTLRDLQFVLTFTQAYEGDQLRQLVAALCPAIYGHELVKAGLLLSLFGGVRKHAGSANRVAIRGDINVLLVGDPGLGKSQLLQAAAAAAPRGLYVCGNTATAAGLTVSVVRDAVTGDCMFEAGAVVLADRGVCCVDEFDKMPGEHQALLEAMEQQEVSVAKAGLVASLPARTAVVAAANPVGGHFDRGRTVRENLRLSPAMLSRFDLVFVLLDRPDELADQALSEHVMALHSGLAERAAAARQRLLRRERAHALSQAPSLSGVLNGVGGGAGGGSQATTTTATTAGGGAGGAGAGAPPPRAPLALRLKLPADGAAEGSLLPPQLLRKYIAYAREHVHPVLSDEAKDILQAFYLSLRASSCGGIGGSLPITARQLESLVRLAEARARAELREVVTADDAQDVIEVMREGMFEAGPLGGLLPGGVPALDFRPPPGARGGRASEAARFVAALRAAALAEGRDVFATAELHALAAQLQVKAPARGDVDAFIQQLNDGGELLSKGAGRWRVSGVPVGGGGGGGGFASTQQPSQSQSQSQSQSAAAAARRKRPGPPLPPPTAPAAGRHLQQQQQQPAAWGVASQQHQQQQQQHLQQQQPWQRRHGGLGIGLGDDGGDDVELEQDMGAAGGGGDGGGAGGGGGGDGLWPARPPSAFW